MAIDMQRYTLEAGTLTVNVDQRSPVTSQRITMTHTQDLNACMALYKHPKSFRPALCFLAVLATCENTLF